jgi:hypothetical protein
MLQGNYEQILKMMAESSGISASDIERRIEAKRAKLSGLISKEGAAQIIASELGISFDKQKMKISGLLSGMRRITIVGKVIKMNKVIAYNKNGKSGKIGSFQIADDTSNIRVVLWDTNHISLIESGNIKEGDVVELSNGDIRNSEIHVSSFGDIKISAQILENVQDKPVLQNKPLKEARMNDNIVARAFIVQIFGPTFYNTCSQCNKKLAETGNCEVHGVVTPKKNAILTLILDDGTENLRAVLFSESIKKLINLNEIPDTEGFVPIRKELMGKEILVEGNVRKSKISDNLEMFMNNISEIDIDKVIEELEKQN